MPKITYIESNGTEHVVEARNGMSVMEAAIENLIPGIEAECGGALACATCHVYVDQAWLEKTGEVTPVEQDMLADGIPDDFDVPGRAAELGWTRAV